MKNLVPIKRIFNEEKVTKELVQSFYDEDMHFILKMYFIPEAYPHFHTHKETRLPKKRTKEYAPFYKFKILYKNYTEAKDIEKRHKILKKYFEKIGREEAKLVIELLRGQKKHPKLAKIIKQLYGIDSIFKPYKIYNKKTIKYPATVIGVPMGIRMFIFVEENGEVRLAFENHINIFFPDLVKHFEQLFYKMCLTNIVLEGILNPTGVNYLNVLIAYKNYTGVHKYKIFITDYMTKDEYTMKVKTNKLVRDSRLQQLLSKIKSSVLITTTPMIAENEQQLLKYLTTKKYFSSIYALLIGDPNSYIGDKNQYTIYYNSANYILKVVKIGSTYIKCESSDGKIKATIKKGITKQVLDKLKALPKDKQGVKMTFLKVFKNIFRTPAFISCGYSNDYIDSRTDCIEKNKSFEKEVK